MAYFNPGMGDSIQQFLSGQTGGYPGPRMKRGVQPRLSPMPMQPNLSPKPMPPGGCKCPDGGGTLTGQMPQPGAPNESEMLDVLGRRIKQQLG